MKIVQRNISLDFKREITEKTGIVYHWTAGNMPGAELELAKPDMINVPFIICRNGQINQYFDTNFWAYHTGTGNDKHNIGIEIECWGGLTMRSGFLVPWTNSIKQAVSMEKAVMLNHFRGNEWFELLTLKQLDAIDWLTGYLVDKHPTIKRFSTHAELNNGKADFPPDYHQIYNIIQKYRSLANLGKHSLTDKNEIPNGFEHEFNSKQIQDRINWLIKNNGWSNDELKRLTKYRDRK